MQALRPARVLVIASFLFAPALVARLPTPTETLREGYVVAVHPVDDGRARQLRQALPGARAHDRGQDVLEATRGAFRERQTRESH